MNLLLILISFAHAISAKLIFPGHLTFEYNNGVDKTNFKPKFMKIVWKNPLWVLKLSNGCWEDLRLTNASEAEEHDYNSVMGSMINRLALDTILQPQRRIKKDNPEKYYKNSNQQSTGQTKQSKNYNIVTEIMKIINKFIMSTRSEPESYLPESTDDGPLIAMYFQGPFTSLAVSSGRKQWHYVVRPPSPLPAWFYEKHPDVRRDGPTVYVEIPDMVKEEFYKALLRLLNLFLTIPV